MADYPAICLLQTLAIAFQRVKLLAFAFVIQEEKMILHYHSIAPVDDEDITRGEKCSDLISYSAVTFLAPLCSHLQVVWRVEF